MIAPYPFTRAIYLYGDPISIPRDGDVEQWRLRIQQVLDDLAAEAENNFEELWRSG